MKLFHKVKSYFKVRYFALRLSLVMFFSTKYWRAYEAITLRLLACSNDMVRKLIIKKGKDPDYVAPPPPPPEPVKEVVDNRRGNTAFAFGNAGFVKNVGKHPVLESRRQLEEKLRAKKIETAPV